MSQDARLAEIAVGKEFYHEGRMFLKLPEGLCERNHRGHVEHDVNVLQLGGRQDGQDEAGFEYGHGTVHNIPDETVVRERD